MERAGMPAGPIHRGTPWLTRGGDDSQFLARVCNAWLLRPGADAESLHKTVHRFSVLPYENVSKILKAEATPQGGDPRRFPAEVLADHLREGMGGTCFSLTAFMESVLSVLGFAPRRVLADMRAGPAMHSAVLAPLNGRLWLVDPGYCLDEPLVLPEAHGSRSKGNGVELLRESDGQVSLFTVNPRGETTWRYRFDPSGVGTDAFAQRWIDSFTWSTTRSLLITARRPEGLHYLHDHHLRLTPSNDAGPVREHLDEGLGRRAHELFGLPADKVERAFLIARRRREEITDHERRT